jgi:predicted methyltransferase
VLGVIGRGRSGQVHVPVNFRKEHVDLTYTKEDKVFYERESCSIATKIWKDLVKNNSSCEVSIDGGTALLDMLVRKSKDGEVFQLREPALEKSLVGPYLDLSETKMHVTKGEKSSQSFSQRLSKALRLRPGAVVLEPFLGLGYSAAENLAGEAKAVYLFEKYSEVVELLQKNPFSPKLSDSRLHLTMQDVSKTNDFFAQLDKIGVKFDALLIDPPKRNVMLQVYSAVYLQRLRRYLKPGATISAYVPETGVSLRFNDMRKQVVPAFESARCRWIGPYRDDPAIFTFEAIP